MFDVKFIFRVSGSTDTSLESNGGSFLDTAIAYRKDFNINLFDVSCFLFKIPASSVSVKAGKVNVDLCITEHQFLL